MKYTFEGKTVEHIDINDPVFERVFAACAFNSLWTHYYSIEPLYAMYRNVCHVVSHGIPGDIVECGVWRGGVMQLAALTLKELGDTTRNLYLYDTFDGMPEPESRDVAADGSSAHDAWKEFKDQGRKWGFGGTLETVQEILHSTTYPREKIRFVQGMVEDTIPLTIPEGRIAILRLDTDLYGSTRHELENLYPKLSVGGFLIVDDYGYYRGARDAADEYFAKNKIQIFLSRLNFSAYEGVKPKELPA